MTEFFQREPMTYAVRCPKCGDVHNLTIVGFTEEPTEELLASKDDMEAVIHTFETRLEKFKAAYAERYG